MTPRSSATSPGSAATALAAEPVDGAPIRVPSWRWLPFLLAAVLSIALSFDAPRGRKPFRIDWDVSWSSLEFSLFKEPHIGASALIGVLALLAVQRGRWPLAVLLTVVVGAGWEIGQTTVVGHSARLADLLPDALGGALGVAWGAAMQWIAGRVGSE